MPLFCAQRLCHLPDLLQLLCCRLHTGRKVDARLLSHHADVAFGKEFVERVGALRHVGRPEHVHDLPVVGVSDGFVLCKVQHFAIWQDVTGLFKGARCSELLLRHLAVIRSRPARLFGCCIVGQLLVLLHRLSPCFQLRIGFPDTFHHFSDSVIQFSPALVELFPLCQIILVFLTRPVFLSCSRENAIGSLLGFNGFHFVAVHPAGPLFFQLAALLFQRFAFLLQRVQTFCFVRHFVRKIFCEVRIMLDKVVKIRYSKVRRTGRHFHGVSNRVIVCQRPGSIRGTGEGSLLSQQWLLTHLAIRFFFVGRVPTILCRGLCDCHIKGRGSVVVQLQFCPHRDDSRSILQGRRQHDHPIHMRLSFFIRMSFQRNCISKYFLNVGLYQRKVIVFSTAQIRLFIGAFLDVRVSVNELYIHIFHPEGLTWNSELIQDRSNRFVNILCLLPRPIRFTDPCRPLCVCLRRVDGQRHLSFGLLCFRFLCHVRQGIPHPLLFRRALGFEGCGVFFCCPQGVHGLFGVGEVFVLQGPSLGLGQPLCLQGGGIAGVDGQHFLGPADDVAQQILHPVHHLVDGTPHARIFLRLSALEFHPALEIRFRRKDPPPRIGHQLFGCLFVGKLLAGVHVHLVPDHLVYALISVHLGKVGQGMVLQALCARLVEGVIPVVVLVQHGAENVADVVPEENTGRLAVHIGPDVRIVLQHVLQHSVGAGSGGVQLDDPAAHVGAVVIQRPFIVDPPLSARALVGQAAAVAARLFLGVCTVEVGGIQRDPPALAAVQNVIDVQSSIVHHTGQPQRVVEALHLVHLRQMVDR